MGRRKKAACDRKPSFSVTLTPELADKIRAQVQFLECTYSKFFEDAIAMYLENQVMEVMDGAETAEAGDGYQGDIDRGEKLPSSVAIAGSSLPGDQE